MGDPVQNVLEGDRKNAVNSPKGPIYRVADITVEPGLARVLRGGEPVDLRPKTYRFLIFLIQNHNRLVTKDELVAGVWDGAAVSDDVLVRSVAELRKLFGDDPRQPQIVRTFPKLGYGLMVPVEIVKETAEPAPLSPRGRRWLWITAAAVVPAAALIWAWTVSRGPYGPPYAEVAWWKLDGVGPGVSDDSGRGHSGSVHGSPAPVEGRRGGALRFDAMADYVSGPGSRALPAGDAARTITAWVQLATPRVDPTGIFEYGKPDREDSSERFFLGVGVDGIVKFGPGATAQQLGGRTRIDDGGWHMVAGSYEGPPSHIARIYVDGALESERTLSAAPATRARDGWRLGQHLAFANAFRGAVDDLRVFGVALDPSKVQALYRCSAGVRDLGEYFYLPIAQGAAMDGRDAGDASTPFRNDGRDYAGIQLARARNDCSLGSLRGANAGEDLRISVDLLVPSAPGVVSDAGPYFRSRAAAPGDGIIGGTSAGYWVELRSNGMIKVRRLNPLAVVAFSAETPGFDSAVYHHLEVEARGEDLTVKLDGRAIRFEQDGRQVERVRMPPAWNGPPASGRNDGAAGILFGAEENRGRIGGQRAKNLRIERL